MGSMEYEKIEKVIRYLVAHHTEQPNLSDLAKVAHLSEFHFHRLFSKWAGITPKTLLKVLTVEHAKKCLEESQDLLSVSHQVGLSGPSRLHDLFVTMEALSPGEYKSKGKGLALQFGVHDSPFGRCLIAMSPRGICYLSFIDEDSEKREIEEMKTEWQSATWVRDQVLTSSVIENVFKKSGQSPLRIHAIGSPFQVKVWNALLKIPPSALTSYGRIAESIGCPGASRAVGTAVGKNAISYLIPCHRVIRETGVVGNYRWGRNRKLAILAWEAKEE